MNTEPSNKHDELKALLAQSFHAQESEEVPPLPEGLRDRIRDQYGKAISTAPAPAEQSAETFFGKISRLFAQPQFSGAVAAIVLIAVAAFLLIPERNAELGNGMRGNPVTPNTESVTIVLYGFEAEKAESIKSVLDPSVATIKEDLSNEPAAQGTTIILDASEGEIQGYANPDAEAQVVELPQSEAQIADAIARLLKELKDETNE